MRHFTAELLEAPHDRILVEHHAAAIEIDAAYLVDRLAERKQRADDRARAGSGDVVEIVRQHERRLARLLAHDALDPCQDLDRDQPPYPAAVEGKQLAWARLSQLGIRACKHESSLVR